MIRKRFRKNDGFKIIMFVLTAYALPFVLSLFVKSESVAEVFVIYMMILPTFGIVLGRIVLQKRIQGWLSWLYTVTFFAFSFVILLCLAGVLSGAASNTILQVFLIFSVCLFFGCIIDEGDLYPFKNFKKVIGIYVLFMVLNMVLQAPVIFREGLDIVEILYELFFVPFSIFIVEGIYIFGEEYAWRGCLMGRLQQLFGKRIGVIILGIVWELWHMPLWFSQFGLGLQEIPAIQLILIRMIRTTGMAVFLGWVYMKTNNIWACVLVHGLNNAAAYGHDASSASAAISRNDVIVTIISAIILMSFLFGKEFRKEKCK